MKCKECQRILCQLVWFASEPQNELIGLDAWSGIRAQSMTPFVEYSAHGIVDLRGEWILIYPDSKIRVTNMGPIWDRQGPGGSHVGPMNLAIRDVSRYDRSWGKWYTIHRPVRELAYGAERQWEFWNIV